MLKLVSDEHPAKAIIALVTNGSEELKLVSDEQCSQACRALVANGSDELKLVSDKHLYQARYTLVAVGSGVLNEVSPLCRHALLKFTLVASVPSRASLGNDVRAEHAFHADEKLFELLKFKAGNDARLLLPNQA